jgi:type III secretion system YscQ/HrcQ family protein
MTPGDRRLAALAAALAKGRAAELLARGAGQACAAEAARLSGLSRAERIGALAASLGGQPRTFAAVGRTSRERPRIAALVRAIASGAPPREGVSPLLARLAREQSGPAADGPGGTGGGRPSPAGPAPRPRDHGGRPPARRVEEDLPVPLPFELPSISRGFAALTPAARRAGREVATAAAAALGAVLGTEVGLEGFATPGTAGPGSTLARVGIELAALPAAAVLEVEPALVVRLVDRLAGGEGAPAFYAELTPVEATLLELLALVALDGACGVAGVEALLAPRLARGGPEPASALRVELVVTAGPVRGRARLLLDPAAVRALGGEPDLARSALALPLSYRSGQAALDPAELDALAPGDVVLIDPAPDGGEVLELPGGFRARGRLDDDGFHVEETAMTTRTAQIPVTLEVELARVEVSLAELARLEPGAVLPLAIDRRGLVTLRAGERPVARGELVDIDGAVGVRITSLEVTP